MTGRHLLVVCALALLGTAVRSQITCPEGYGTPCGDVCFRLEGDTYCDTDGGRSPVPMSQEAIDCLLAFTKETDLPVLTDYSNLNGVSFTSWYDDSVVAPAELVGEPGPGGNTYAEWYVIIDRNSGRLVRSGYLGTGRARVCEKSPSSE